MQQPPLPHISEPEVILRLTENQHKDQGIQKHNAAAALAWTSISSAMKLDRCRTGCDPYDQTRVPSDDTTEHVTSQQTTLVQRSFHSTKRLKVTKRQLKTSKPTAAEKKFFLKALDGDEPVISHQAAIEHDNSSNVSCQVINFEHLYVIPQ